MPQHEAVVIPAEQRVVLQNVSWETYEHLLWDHVDASTPRFTFDRGVLEIMSPSSEHERYKQALSLLVEMLADGLGIDIENLGSTTFKRSQLERGFEADVCFYVQSATRMHGKVHIDPTKPFDVAQLVELACSACHGEGSASN